MKSLPFTLLLLVLASCAADTRYPGWQNVRIVKDKPSEDCLYVAQEACYERNAIEGCLNYFKKRAIRLNANIVMLVKPSNLLDGSSLADYYSCKV